MTTENAQPIKFWRKLVIPMIAGAVCGGIVAAGTITLLDSGWMGEGDTDPSRMIAAITGALYVLIAVGSMIGTASPAFGAKYLNAEDADELREQRAMLMNSGIAMLTWGIGLFLLTLAAPFGPLEAPVAGVTVGLLLIVGIVFAWRSHARSDELFASINRDATVIGYYLIFALAGGWAILSQLELVPMFEPLDLMTMFYLTSLLAAFIAAGKRGMLNPR